LNRAELQQLSEDRVKDSRTLLAANRWPSALTAKDWSESSRYRMSTQLQAEKLFYALTDNTDGVLPWVKNFW
jgi:hypothetical protein